MARILDENFREQGYSEFWFELINAGCSIDENYAVSAITAGITAPSTYYRRCFRCDVDGDATNACLINHSFAAPYPTDYFFRLNFIINSSQLAESGIFTIAFARDSASSTVWSSVIRYTLLAGMQFRSLIQNCGLQTTYASVSLNYNNLLEVKWDINNERYECRINGSSIHTVNLTNTVTASSLREIYVGNTGGSGSYSVYIDNIRINDNTGTINNSWPGTSYDEPIREIDYLSTQQLIGMSL